MKKLLALILAAIMLLTLAACGEGESTTAAPDNQGQENNQNDNNDNNEEGQSGEGEGSDQNVAQEVLDSIEIITVVKKFVDFDEMTVPEGYRRQWDENENKGTMLTLLVKATKGEPNYASGFSAFRLQVADFIDSNDEIIKKNVYVGSLNVPNHFIAVVGLQGEHSDLSIRVKHKVHTQEGIRDIQISEDVTPFEELDGDYIKSGDVLAGDIVLIDGVPYIIDFFMEFGTDGYGFGFTPLDGVIDRETIRDKLSFKPNPDFSKEIKQLDKGPAMVAFNEQNRPHYHLISDVIEVELNADNVTFPDDGFASKMEMYHIEYKGDKPFVLKRERPSLWNFPADQ